jgi:hypothetical protein
MGSMPASSKDLELFGLLKFGRPEHMEALPRKGVLFLNTLNHFQRLEEPGDIKRADPDEGLFRAYGPQVSGFTTTFGGQKFEFSPGTGPLKLWTPQSRKMHVYSMCAITKPATLTVDGNILAVADYELVAL